MTVKLLFLGRLEDLAGVPELSMPGGTIEHVLAALDPALAVDLLGERVRMALNGRIISERGGIVVGEGDELAFLPPVSGG